MEEYENRPGGRLAVSASGHPILGEETEEKMGSLLLSRYASQITVSMGVGL